MPLCEHSMKFGGAGIDRVCRSRARCRHSRRSAIEHRRHALTALNRGCVASMAMDDPEAGAIRDHYTSRWRSLGPISTSRMLTQNACLLAPSSAVDSVLDTAASASAACGVDAPETQFEATQLLRLLAHLKSLPGTIPPTRLDFGGLARVQ